MTTNKEISFIDVVNKVVAFIKLLLRNWLFLGCCSLVGGIIGIAIAFYTKPTYEAKSVFVLSNQPRSSGLMNLASQFGFSLGNSGADAFSDDNILSLFRSVYLSERVLFKKLPNTNDNLINLYCRSLQLDKGWAKKDRLKHAFPFPLSPKLMTGVQDSLFREVQDVIMKSNFNVVRNDKKTNIYEIYTKSKNEMFALYFTRYIVDETTQFYIETKTKLARQNLDMLQKEADSLRTLLERSINSTAVALDNVYNLNPSLQVNRTPVQKNQAQTTVIAAAYGEVVKNLEVAKITLQKETPLFQMVDEPRMPLKAKKLGKLFSLVVGSFLAGVLGIMFLLFKKLLKVRRAYGK
ncbi:MAG TPA: hypothetical protein DCL43_13705 [Chitinophagaceae bacterium]|nr:hypothetical protein [Chitinophagaceae bacterium]HAN38611.1 hypothetical protein [Chitinophagaceae bacterium]